jgi:hemolysin III
MDGNKQVKEHRISIPNYTLAEELINSISHGVGALLGITALILCVVLSVLHGDVWAVVSSAIYGSALIILYSMSAIYHALRVNMAKRVFRVIDHCSIYLLIAGTYTPFTLVALRNERVLGLSLGWVVFGIVWGAAIIGITLNAVDLKKFRIFSMISYIAMGWVIIVASVPLSRVIGSGGTGLLLGGGVIYTVGALFYAFGKKHKFMHSLFHVFVIAGSILHFFSILLYVI